MELALVLDVFQNRCVQGHGNRCPKSNNIQEASLSVEFDIGVLVNIFSTDTSGNDFGFTVMGDNAVMRFQTNPWLPKAGENMIEIKSYDGTARQVAVDGTCDAFGFQIRKVEQLIEAGCVEAIRPPPDFDISEEIMGLLTEWEHVIA